MDNDNSQVKPILPNMPSGRSSQYSATDYRRYFCQQGMTLHDLYNRLKMYDPYAQFHADENSAQDPICLHSHSYYELIYCLQTVGVSYLVGPQHYFPQKGDLICILPGVSHRPLFSEGMSGSFRRIVFNLNTEFVARLFRQYAVAAPEDVFGSAFCSLTDKQFRHYEKLFRDPELFLPTPIGIMPMKCTPDQYRRLMQERSAADRGER